jgi:phage-related protein
MMSAYFYHTDADNEPVREWLKALDRVDRKVIGDDLQTVQLGWQAGLIGEPLVKSLGSGLFEVRTSLLNHRIARVFFCTYESRMVLLHAFIKKTRKTPEAELILARKRQKSLQR